jgi:hypothetical protein
MKFLCVTVLVVAALIAQADAIQRLRARANPCAKHTGNYDKCKADSGCKWLAPWQKAQKAGLPGCCLPKNTAVTNYGRICGWDKLPDLTTGKELGVKTKDGEVPEVVATKTTRAMIALMDMTDEVEKCRRFHRIWTVQEKSLASFKRGGTYRLPNVNLAGKAGAASDVTGLAQGALETTSSTIGEIAGGAAVGLGFNLVGIAADAGRDALMNDMEVKQLAGQNYPAWHLFCFEDFYCLRHGSNKRNMVIYQSTLGYPDKKTEKDLLDLPYYSGAEWVLACDMCSLRNIKQVSTTKYANWFAGVESACADNEIATKAVDAQKRLVALGKVPKEM